MCKCSPDVKSALVLNDGFDFLMNNYQYSHHTEGFSHPPPCYVHPLIKSMYIHGRETRDNPSQSSNRTAYKKKLFFLQKCSAPFSNSKSLKLIILLSYNKERGERELLKPQICAPPIIIIRVLGIYQQNYNSCSDYFCTAARLKASLLEDSVPRYLQYAYAHVHNLLKSQPIVGVVVRFLSAES